MFSIIMPAYNAEKTIAESIDSVLTQSFEEFELLIIDDCSSDQTVKIIERYASQDARVKLLKNLENSGVAVTRNKGIEVAKFPYICFLDSDDLWTSDKLSEYYSCFQGGEAVIYSFYTRFTKDKTFKLVTSPLEINYSRLLRGNCIGNLTGAYDSSVLGKFYQKTVRHEDYLMWLEIVKKSHRAVCIPKNLAFYRVANSSLSGNKVKSILWTWNLYHNELKLNIFYALYLLMQSSVKAIFKRIG